MGKFNIGDLVLVTGGGEENGQGRLAEIVNTDAAAYDYTVDFGEYIQGTTWSCHVGSGKETYRWMCERDLTLAETEKFSVKRDRYKECICSEYKNRIWRIVEV